MKLSRPLILIPTVILAFAAAVIGTLLTPAFQRWALLRFAADHPEWHLQVSAVSAGPARVSLEGVQAEYRGSKFSLAQLDAEYSLWSWLFSDRLEINDLQVRGLRVDVSGALPGEASAGAGAPLAAPAALARLQLPWELVLEKTRVEGHLLLPGAPGEGSIAGEFKLTGRNIMPDRDGEIAIGARLTRFVNQTAGQSVAAEGTLQLRETSRRNFDRLRVALSLTAAGPDLPAGAKLHLMAGATRTAGGESYELRLGETAAGDPWLILNAAPSADGFTLSGDWRLAANSAQLAAFLLGHPSPDFAANGSGKFSIHTGKPAGTVQGRLDLGFSKLETVNPVFQPVGALQLNGDFDLALDENGLLRCPLLQLAVKGAAPVLELRTTGVPVFDLRRRRLASAGVKAEEFLRVNLAGLPVAWLAPLFSSVGLSGEPITGTISVTRGDDDRLLAGTIAPLQSPALTVTREGRTLLDKGAFQFEAAAELLSDRVVARLTRANLTTAVGDRLSASGSLDWPVGGDEKEWSAEAKFTADLPALIQPWQPGVAFKGSGDLAVAGAAGKIDVRRCALEATDPQGEMLALVHLVHSFRFDPASGHFATEGDPDAQGETVLASVRIGQWPQVTLFQPFPSMLVTGRPSPAEAWISAAGGRLVVRTGAPVSIMDFTVTERKRVLLDRMKVTLKPEVVFDQGALVLARTGDVAVLSAGESPLAELQAELRRTEDGLRAASTFNLDLPAWATQPVLFGREMLSAGQAVGEIRAALADDLVQVEARATCNSMVVLDGGQVLPVVNLSLKSTVDSSGKFTLAAPVLLDRGGRRSDVRFSASGEILPVGLAFTGGIKSEHLEFADLLLFLAAAGSPLGGEGTESSAAQARALSPPPADAEPFWSGYQGRFELDCASLVGQSDWAMRGLRGSLAVSSEGMRLERLEAALGGQGSFTGQAQLAFAGGMDPYELTGSFALNQFDLGRFQRALNGDQAPVVEGLFNIEGRLTGRGLNFADTVDRTGGNFDLSSRQGVFRGLKRSTDKVSMATKAVDLMSTFLGDKAEKMAGASFYVDQLAQDFGELKFEQGTARLIHEPGRELRLENLVLLSPEVHLQGGGKVTYEPGRPLLEQPLTAQFSLRVRGKMETLLGKLDQVEGTRDPQGYVGTRTPVHLGGTLGRPNPQKYFAELAVSKISEAIDRLLKPKG